MRLRAIALSQVDGDEVEVRDIEGDDPDEVFARAYLFAADHIAEHVQVHNADTDELEFANPPGVG